MGNGRIQVLARNAEGKMAAILYGEPPKGPLEFIDRRLYASDIAYPLLTVPAGGRLEIGASE
jgi:hypothetical protein